MMILGPPHRDPDRMLSPDLFDQVFTSLGEFVSGDSVKSNLDLLFVYPRIVSAKVIGVNSPQIYRDVILAIADNYMEWDLLHWTEISMDYMVQYDRLDFVKVLFDALTERGVSPRQLQGRKHSSEWFDRYEMNYGWICFQDEHSCLKGLRVSPAVFGMVEGFLYPN